MKRRGSSPRRQAEQLALGGEVGGIHPTAGMEVDASGVQAVVHYGGAGPMKSKDLQSIEVPGVEPGEVPEASGDHPVGPLSDPSTGRLAMCAPCAHGKLIPSEPCGLRGDHALPVRMTGPEGEREGRFFCTRHYVFWLSTMHKEDPSPAGRQIIVDETTYQVAWVEAGSWNDQVIVKAAIEKYTEVVAFEQQLEAAAAAPTLKLTEMKALQDARRISDLTHEVQQMEHGAWQAQVRARVAESSREYVTELLQRSGYERTLFEDAARNTYSEAANREQQLLTEITHFKQVWSELGDRWESTMQFQELQGQELQQAKFDTQRLQQEVYIGLENLQASKAQATSSCSELRQELVRTAEQAERASIDQQLLKPVPSRGSRIDPEG